jgi:hypothetical protein
MSQKLLICNEISVMLPFIRNQIQLKVTLQFATSTVQ